MLNLAVRNTKKLVREKVKDDNVRLGRFFTKKEQAALMASLPELPEKEVFRVLDPGAGTGILSAAIVERLAAEGHVREIHLTCYETNPAYLPMLTDNLERIRRKCRHDYKVKLYPTVIEENYLLSRKDALSPKLPEDSYGEFDIVIMNPPHDPIPTDCEEFSICRRLCSGETDLGYLFAAAAVTDLAAGGELVMMQPVVFSSAAYAEKLRKFLFSRTVLTKMHLFLNRTDSDRVLDGARKNMILCLRRSQNAPELVRISTSYGDTGDVHTVMRADYATVVRGEEKSILLLKSAEEAKIMEIVAHFPCTLTSLGLRMRTGLTIESRYPNLLRSEPEEGTVPLIHPSSIQLGQIAFPRAGVKNQYLVAKVASILQPNKNMLFIKRIPAKSDKKALFCGAYLASQLPRFRYISTHNKLNYIDYADGREMDFNMVYGLFVVLNSSLYGKYYQVVSKSKQINATEFAELPLPSAPALRAMGAKLAMSRVFSEKACDNILLTQMRSGKL